jgi:lipopolysaccharide export system permease protein
MKIMYLFDRGISVIKFMEISVLLLPSMMYSVLPLCSVYACLQAYYRMRSEREILVMHIFGVDNFLLQRPLIYFGLMVSSISILLAMYIVPISYHTFKNEIHSFMNTNASRWIIPGVFNNLTKKVILYTKYRDNDHSLHNVIVIDYREPGLPLVLIAKKGIVYFENNTIKCSFIDGESQRMNSNHTLDIMKFASLNIDVDDKNDNSIRDWRGLQEIPTLELIHPKDVSIARGIKMKAELHNRIVWSLCNIAFSYFAVSMFLYAKHNKKGYFFALLKSFGIVCIFLNLHFVFCSMASKNSAYILLMYSNLMICLLGGMMLNRSYD